MTRARQKTPSTTTDATAPRDKDVRSVSKRWANWATNLLVSGVVIVAGLALGRQVRQWWVEDAAQLTSRNDAAGVLGPSAVGPGEQPQYLEFGDLPFAFTRVEIAGSANDVLAVLRRHGHDAADAAGPELADRMPGAAEMKMVEQTARLTPIDEEPGRWQMFQLDGPLPMVAVIGQPRAAEDSDAALVAARRRRVLSWGVAIPKSDGEQSGWTLFTWGASNGAANRLAGLSELPLPAGSQRTMSLTGDEGSGLVAFRGTGSINTWKVAVDEWFGDHGWSLGTWRLVSDVWHARFNSPDGAWIDVQVAVAERQQLRGLLTIVSAKGKQE